MATLLLELFSEEIPSRMQRNAAEQLERLVLDGFKKHSLAPAGCKTFVSPRHLAIQCFGLPLIQPDVKEEKRGPKIGAPEQAMKGFLQSSGLTLEQCEQRDGYYYVTIEKKGGPVTDTLKKIIEEALSAFSWPKSMRWGSHSLAWVRPLHRIACLLDDAVVPVQLAHLTASNVTEGHRFLAPTAIVITHAEHYEKQLLDAKVMVDFAARRAKIAADIAALASAAKLGVIADEDLLNEVTGLVEWPVPLLCQFDKKFLDLPPEVLISEMKNHQRYFALTSADDKLSDQFITIANMVNADGGERVKAGNARVVRARLADGEFYWEQDRKVSLEDWGKKLSDVVFHAKVGMMNEKVARIEALAVAIAKAVGYGTNGEAGESPLPQGGRGLGEGESTHAQSADSHPHLSSPSVRERDARPATVHTLSIDNVRRAAQLCKADLTSGMVGEFPELQGIMGRYYALAQGESAEIADAIRDHYKPVGAGDSVPEANLAAIIAIADKLDSIVSLFAAGEKPTGSKDPLALRRAALGIIRIAVDQNWNFDILAHITIGSEERGEISQFFRERLKTMLRENGMRADVVEVAFRDEVKGFNPVKLKAYVDELNAWLASPTGTTTLAAIKRAMNILALEEKKSKQTFAAGFSDKLTAPAEKDLIATLKELDSRLRGNDKKPEMLDALAAPINQFFTDLLVTEEGFRDARLSLLAAVRDAANTIADFSKIEG